MMDCLVGDQIWSDYHKTFRDDFETSMYLFEDTSVLSQTFPGNKIANRFCVRPDYVGFESELPDGHLMEKDKISQIPFLDIVDYLKKIHQNPDHQRDDNNFPQPLQDKLDKFGVKYETWAIEDLGRGGDSFVTPYYSISIDMHFFG